MGSARSRTTTGAVLDHRERLAARGQHRHHQQHDLHGDAVDDQRQNGDRELRDCEWIGAGAGRLHGEGRHVDVRGRHRDADDRRRHRRQQHRHAEQGLRRQTVGARQRNDWHCLGNRHDCRRRHVDPVNKTSTTAADFTGGTLDAGAYNSEDHRRGGDSAPSNGTEFSGTKLSGGWKTTALVKKGTAVVGSGSIKLQGSEIVSTFQVVGINRWLEFMATLNGAPQQAAGVPLAQFNTRANGTVVSLYARTLNGKVPVETLIPGTWFNAPHVFRIEWNSSSVVYSIDGSIVASHKVVFPSSVKMTFVGSDMFTSTGALTIDWIRFGPYTASGSFISRVFDAGGAASWLTMTWTVATPSGTAVIMSYRTGNTAGARLQPGRPLPRCPRPGRHYRRHLALRSVPHSGIDDGAGANTGVERRDHRLHQVKPPTLAPPRS